MAWLQRLRPNVRADHRQASLDVETPFVRPWAANYLTCSRLTYSHPEVIGAVDFGQYPGDYPVGWVGDSVWLIEGVVLGLGLGDPKAEGFIFGHLNLVFITQRKLLPP